MQNFIKKDNLYIVVNTTIFLLIILFNAFCYQNVTFWNEDIGFGFYKENESIFDCLFHPYNGNAYGGGYFQPFFIKLFTLGIPFVFNIHPLDFASFPKGFIFGFIIAFLVFSNVKFIKFTSHSKLLFSSLLLVAAYYTFHAYYNDTAHIVDINNYVIFRYHFGILIYNIFWFFIYKNLLKNNLKINISELSFIIICSIFLCSGLETLILMSFLNIFLLILYKVISNIKFNKNITVSLLCFIFAEIIWIFSKTFSLALQTKVPIVPIIDKQYLVEFCNKFINLYFPLILPYILLLLILIIILYVKKKTLTKHVIFSLILEISAILGVLSLFFCGKHFAGNFYIVHESIIFTFKMLIIPPFLILIGSLISQIRKYKIRGLVSFLIGTSLIGFSFFAIPDLVKQTPKNAFLRQHKNNKTINYIEEKLLRFYYLKREVPVISNYGVQFSLFSNNIEKYNEGACTNNEITRIYLPKVYNDDVSKNLGYCISEHAIDKFYENGGFFTEYELNDINFSKLKDKNFVLHQPYNKVIPKEIMNEKMNDMDELVIYKPL